MRVHIFFFYMYIYDSENKMEYSKSGIIIGSIGGIILASGLFSGIKEMFEIKTLRNENDSLIKEIEEKRKSKIMILADTRRRPHLKWSKYCVGGKGFKKFKKWIDDSKEHHLEIIIHSSSNLFSFDDQSEYAKLIHEHGNVSVYIPMKALSSEIIVLAAKNIYINEKAVFSNPKINWTLLNQTITAQDVKKYMDDLRDGKPIDMKLSAVAGIIGARLISAEHLLRSFGYDDNISKKLIFDYDSETLNKHKCIYFTELGIEVNINKIPDDIQTIFNKLF